MRIQSSSLLLLFCCFALTCVLALQSPSQQLHGEFETYKQRFSKTYDSDDEHERSRENFFNNAEHIVGHQTSDTQGNYGHSKFSDLSREEFASRYLRFNKDLLRQMHGERQFSQMLAMSQSKKRNNDDLPKQFDWRDRGVITPVKFQSTCGSCWTFSTTGIIESQFAIKYGQLFNFSEQMLLDCDPFNQGCTGGLMTEAFKFIQRSGGIPIASDYGEYKNKKVACHFNNKKVKARVTSWHLIDSDEDVIQRELVENGPIAIGIDANFLQFYDGGVSDPEQCSNEINHAVLLVGYGEDAVSGKKYWIVKNQWGQDWGNHGFFNLVRGKGRCGVHTYASIASVERA